MTVQELLSDMDATWLSYWRCLLVGLPATDDDRHKLQAATQEILELLLQSMDLHLNSSEYVTAYQTLQVIRDVICVDT